VLRATAVALLALTLGTGTAGARTLMTAEEFEAWSTGQTLDYWIDGAYWGSERHLSGRRTLDADATRDCHEGRWFPKGDMICFVYLELEGEHCWHFWRDGTRVMAEVAGEEGSLAAEITLADQPLACAGPDVGV
jgi:hypothetical protein